MDTFMSFIIFFTTNFPFQFGFALGVGVALHRCLRDSYVVALPRCLRDPSLRFAPLRMTEKLKKFGQKKSAKKWLILGGVRG